MSSTNTDESAPIMRSARNGKDYNAISPRLSVRATGADSRTFLEGIQGNQRGQEQQLAEQAAADVERKEETWWAAFWDKYGSVELENKGSVARDHLALGKSNLNFPKAFLPPAPSGSVLTTHQNAHF